jgi:cell division protein FtsW
LPQARLLRIAWGLAASFFVKRHILMIFPALAVMIGSSLLMPRHIRRLAVLIYFAGLALMVATILTGAEVKGAKRWINLGRIFPSGLRVC